MTVNIYVLVDPRTLKVRYIGRTRCTLKKRLGEHVCVDRNKRMTRVKSWIKSLKSINSKPYIRLLTTCEGWEESHLLEQELIERHKEKHDLLNHKDRGAGNPFPINSDFARLQTSKSLKEGYASGRLKPTKVKPVYVYSLEGEFIEEYPTITQCSKVMGISQDSIRRSMQGKCKQGKGFLFRETKTEEVTPLINFHKGIVNDLTVHYKNQVLKFEGIPKCAKHFNIVKPHCNYKYFAQQLFFENADVNYIECTKHGVIKRGNSKRKIVAINHGGNIKYFTSLREVCKFYNWDVKQFGYKTEFPKKFYKHFPTSTLTISPHKIS